MWQDLVLLHLCGLRRLQLEVAGSNWSRAAEKTRDTVLRACARNKMPGLDSGFCKKGVCQYNRDGCSDWSQ